MEKNLETISSASVNIRTIEERDNASLATIIRSTLEEFGANHPGTVYFDASTDALFQLFSNTEGSVYFVAEIKGKLVGGGGIFPTPALPEGTCELVKMYLLPEARGMGLGKSLILKCLAAAKEMGYQQVYLETMPELKLALRTYAHLGFEYIPAALGESGHFGCDLFMLKRLDQDETTSAS